jgi:hypothetical protein
MSLIRTAVAASAVCLLCAPPPVSAQEAGTLPLPIAELSAGYAFMRNTHIDENFPAGWYLSGGVNLSQWFAIVGEAGGGYATVRETPPFGEPHELSSKLEDYAFMGGPRFFRKTGRVVPFGQFLVGVRYARQRETATYGAEPPHRGGMLTATDLAIQPGGGVTVLLTERVGLRVAADFRTVIDTEDETEYTNEFRFITGFTFHWGRR